REPYGAEGLLPRGEPGWIDRAACVETDPEGFFSNENGQWTSGRLELAKRICNRCPVQSECLHYAFQLRNQFRVVGVWGGTTEHDRAELVKEGKFAPLPEETPHVPVHTKESDRKLVSEITHLITGAQYSLRQVADHLGLTSKAIHDAFDRQLASLPEAFISKVTAVGLPVRVIGEEGEDLGSPPEPKKRTVPESPLAASLRRRREEESAREQMELFNSLRDKDIGKLRARRDKLLGKVTSGETADERLFFESEALVYIKWLRTVRDKLLGEVSSDGAADPRLIFKGDLHQADEETTLQAVSVPPEVASVNQQVQDAEKVLPEPAPILVESAAERALVLEVPVTADSEPISETEQLSLVHPLVEKLRATGGIIDEALYGSENVPPEALAGELKKYEKSYNNVIGEALMAQRKSVGKTTKAVNEDLGLPTKVYYGFETGAAVAIFDAEERNSWYQMLGEDLRLLEQEQHAQLTTELAEESFASLFDRAVHLRAGQLGIEAQELAERMGITASILSKTRYGKTEPTMWQWQMIEPVLVADETHPVYKLLKQKSSELNETRIWSRTFQEVSAEELATYSFGKKVDYVIVRAGETQSSLARKIVAKGEIGRTQQSIRTSISLIVTGKPPSPQEWQYLSAALAISPDDALGQSLNEEATRLWQAELTRREGEAAKRTEERARSSLADEVSIIARQQAAALGKELVAQDIEEEFTTALGEDITLLREAKGMTVRELAKAASLSHRTIYITEKGTSVPSRTGVMERMIEALGIDIKSKQGRDLLDKAKKARAAIVSTYQSDKEKAWLLTYLERYGSAQTENVRPLFDDALTERQIRGRLRTLGQEGKVRCNRATNTWELTEAYKKEQENVLVLK
ncbi:MAG: WhiB family transcriptional regulator, partial [Patescibacteria group bacterium]